MTDKNMLPFSKSIAKLLLDSEEKYKNRIALKVQGENYTYGVLFAMAKQIAIHLKGSAEDRCLILAKRNLVSYVCLIACILAGKAYVFLNGKDSIAELKKAITLVNSNLIISDESFYNTVSELASSFPDKAHSLCLNEKGDILVNTLPKTEANLLDLESYKKPEWVYKYVYLMFTSGSTGNPKGVPISHENLYAFLKNIIKRIKPTEQDRFSQINELTFDLSIQEIFPCWIVGACLCVLPENYILAIDKFVQNNAITYWASVPSLINLLKQINRLNATAFKSIRYSVFCGEALTNEMARTWRKHAIHSVIDNLYGPTEATVAITGYLWSEDERLEVVPIGSAYDGQEVLILDNNLQEVADGVIGEMYLCGSQVTDQYWHNAQFTDERFISHAGKLLYKTGDLACFDIHKGLIFKGRIDDQLKINGYRVEKLDIENRIKNILGAQTVCVVAVKDKLTCNVEALYCFYSEVDHEESMIKKMCRQKLPDYMIPHFFFKLEQLPYNKNGKVDYPSLMKKVKREGDYVTL